MKNEETNSNNKQQLSIQNTNTYNDNDLVSLMKKFNVKVPFIDDMIEKILIDILISHDSNDNEKQIMIILINNLKKTYFGGIKFLYITSFIYSIKKMLDNISGGNLKKQIIIKSLAFLITSICMDLSINKFLNFEEYEIDELLTNILNIYNEKVSYKILSNIQNNNIEDLQHIKHQYEVNIELILKINKSSMKVIYNYIKLVNYMTTLYLVPILYDSVGLTPSTFLRTTFLNVYNLILFNVVYKKCEIKPKEDVENVDHGESIEYFFTNLEKIVEGNNGSLNEELYKVSSQLFDYFNNSYLKNTFKFAYFTDERRKQTKIYNFFETVVSLVVNNTSLLVGSDKFKAYFNGFADNKYELNQLLKTSDSLINILNLQKYKVDNMIKWNKNYKYEHAFILKDVSSEYTNTMDNTVSTIKIENISVDFEINNFHFIYGDSGTGKTTLFKIILTKQPIKDGKLKFLGVYENYSYLSIIKYLLVISSESKVFPKSLYYNLTYKIDKNVLKTKHHAIMDAIINYMTLFGLEIFIPTLSTKNATKLSKGQIQKINIIYCILNIMFSTTKILLLDECTSNIDEPTEQIIFSELKKLNKAYPFTCLFISHNLKNLQFSDYSYHNAVSSEKIQTITKSKTKAPE